MWNEFTPRLQLGKRTPGFPGRMSYILRLTLTAQQVVHPAVVVFFRDPATMLERC